MLGAVWKGIGGRCQETIEDMLDEADAVKAQRQAA